VSVAQTYGMSEFGALTFTCASRSNHVYAEDFYVEIVNPKTGEVQGDGEAGEIVITTVTREASPRIRYRTGDIGRLRKGSCVCGSNAPRLDVMGRLSQLAVFKGQRTLPTDIENVICSYAETTGMFRLELLDDSGARARIVIDVVRSADPEAIKHKVLADVGGLFETLEVECSAPGRAHEGLFRRAEGVAIKSLQDFIRPNSGEEAWLVTY
jgi:phenylacetate-CoA ligase